MRILDLRKPLVQVTWLSATLRICATSLESPISLKAIDELFWSCRLGLSDDLPLAAQPKLPPFLYRQSDLQHRQLVDQCGANAAGSQPDGKRAGDRNLGGLPVRSRVLSLSLGRSGRRPLGQTTVPLHHTVALHGAVVRAGRVGLHAQPAPA